MRGMTLCLLAIIVAAFAGFALGRYRQRRVWN
jgi:hypothetical protein